MNDNTGVAVVLFSDNTFEAAGNKRCNVDKYAWQRQTAWAYYIFGAPLRVELFFILPQSLEVVEVFTVPKHVSSEPVPYWREGAVFKS